MSLNTTKTKSKLPLSPVGKTQAAKRNLALNFIKFMASVIAIGILLAPLAGQQPIELDSSLQFNKMGKAEGEAND